MKKFFFSNRAKDIFTLFSGTAISQLVSVIGTFFLASLYFPSDFGIYASFLSLVNIIAISLNLRYEMAIILPKKEFNAIQLVYLCFIISVFLIIFGTLISFFLPKGTDEYEFLNNSSLQGLSELLPYVIPVLLTAWLISNFNVLNYYSVRKGNFKTISKSLLLKAVFILVFQLIFYYFFKGATGLIIGQLLGVSVALLYFLIIYAKDFGKVKFNKSRTHVLKKKYIDFVKYALPGALANTLSLELNSIFILIFFTPAEAGFYFFSMKLLGVPLALIGKSYSQVYLRDASVERNETGRSDKVFIKVLKELTLFSLVCLLLGNFFLDEVIELVFGEKWSEAGVYSLILLPLFMIRLISSSLSGTMTVFEKQKIMLLINLILLALLFLIYIVTNWLEWNILDFLIAYTVLYSIVYLIFILGYYKITINKLL